MNLLLIARQVGVLLALTLVAAVGTKQLHPRPPAWKLHSAGEYDPYQVSMEQITTDYGGDVIWIDARKGEDFEAGHVPKAINLSQEAWNDQLFEHLDTLSSSLKPIVVYCDGEECALSKKVAQELRELGLSEVYYIKGGWKELKVHFPEGLPTES